MKDERQSPVQLVLRLNLTVLSAREKTLRILGGPVQFVEDLEGLGTAALLNKPARRLGNEGVASQHEDDRKQLDNKLGMCNCDHE